MLPHQPTDVALPVFGMEQRDAGCTWEQEGWSGRKGCYTSLLCLWYGGVSLPPPSLPTVSLLDTPPYVPHSAHLSTL